MSYRSRTTWILPLLLAGTACYGPTAPDSPDAPTRPADTPTPDLSFLGKADGGGANTRLGERLVAGRVREGRVEGFVALPLAAEAGEAIEAHGWTSRPAVLFIYGPRQGGRWDFEQVRAFSEGVKPGVHARSVSFDARHAGEYLVVVGALDGQPADWLVTIPADDDAGQGVRVVEADADPEHDRPSASGDADRDNRAQRPPSWREQR